MKSEGNYLNWRYVAGLTDTWETCKTLCSAMAVGIREEDFLRYATIRVFVSEDRSRSRSVIYQNRLHNYYGPAYTLFYPSGQRKEEQHLYRGQVYNINGPHTRKWHPNGQLWKRRHGPEFIERCRECPWKEKWSSNGVLVYREWRDEQGSRTRIGAPCIETWYQNGMPKSQMFMFESRYHNLTGPAVLKWSSSGFCHIEFWRDGMQYTSMSFSEFYRVHKPIK